MLLAPLDSRGQGVESPRPHSKRTALQVKGERPIEAPELARGFVLQPILQRGLQGAVALLCTVRFW